VFYVNLPFGVFACVFGIIYLNADRERPSEHFDALRFLLSASGL